MLFVDDEPGVLSNLGTMLPRRADLIPAFAADADQALDMMTHEPFEVVAADLDLPGTDGTELLGTVRDRSPQSVRIVLFEEHQRDAVLHAAPVAHQSLLKPCTRNTL